MRIEYKKLNCSWSKRFVNHFEWSERKQSWIRNCAIGSSFTHFWCTVWFGRGCRLNSPWPSFLGFPLYPVLSDDLEKSLHYLLLCEWKKSFLFKLVSISLTEISTIQLVSVSSSIPRNFTLPSVPMSLTPFWTIFILYSIYCSSECYFYILVGHVNCL